MNAEWREVPGFTGYSVSSSGLVRRDIKIRGAKIGIARTRRDKAGYLRVNMKRDGERSREWMVHQIVCLAFIGPCPEGMEVCHNDGRPENNRALNLRYGTKKENGEDRVLHGTTLRGHKHPNAKLSDEDVLEIKRLLEEPGANQIAIAARFGLTQAAVGYIATGKNWGWLTKGGATKRKTSRGPCRTLTPEQGRAVVAEKAAGASAKELASKYGVSIVTIYNTLNRGTTGARAMA